MRHSELVWTLLVYLLTSQIICIHSQSTYFLLSNVLAKKCLQVNSQELNAEYTLAPCNSANFYQQFRDSGDWETNPEKESYLKNVGTDHCVCSTAHNINNKDGFPYFQGFCTGDRNQRFVAAGNGKFDSTGKNTFWIQGTNTGREFSVRKERNILVSWNDSDKLDPQNLWTVYTARTVLFKNEATETCIRVKEGNNTNDATVVVAPCDPLDPYQQIEHSGVWKNEAKALSILKVIGSQKCLSGSYVNPSTIGTTEDFLIYQYDCLPQNYLNQNFNLDHGRYDENGTKKFWIRVKGNKCLRPKPGGVDLVQGACKNLPEFTWTVYVAPLRTIALKNLDFQLCMIVNGTNIGLGNCLPPAIMEPKYFRVNSIWERDPMASANLTVYTQMGTNETCLSSASSNTVNNEDGYKLNIASCNPDANYQLYKIGKGKYYPNGRSIFQIVSVPNGKCLSVQSQTDFVAQFTCTDSTNFYWTAVPLPLSQTLQDRPDCIGPKSKKERCGNPIMNATDNNKYLCAGKYPECCWDPTVNFKDDSDPACYKLVM